MDHRKGVFGCVRVSVDGLRGTVVWLCCCVEAYQEVGESVVEHGEQTFQQLLLQHFPGGGGSGVGGGWLGWGVGGG